MRVRHYGTYEDEEKRRYHVVYDASLPLGFGRAAVLEITAGKKKPRVAEDSGQMYNPNATLPGWVREAEKRLLERCTRRDEEPGRTTREALLEAWSAYCEAEERTSSGNRRAWEQSMPWPGQAREEKPRARAGGS